MSVRGHLRRRRGLPAAVMLAAFLMGFLPGHAHGGSLVTDQQAQEAAYGELSAHDQHQHGHDHGERPGADHPVDHGADHGAPHGAPHGDGTCPGCHCPTGATSCGAVTPPSSPAAGLAGTPSPNGSAIPDLALPQPFDGSLFRPPRD